MVKKSKKQIAKSETNKVQLIALVLAIGIVIILFVSGMFSTDKSQVNDELIKSTEIVQPEIIVEPAPPSETETMTIENFAYLYKNGKPFGKDVSVVFDKFYKVTTFNFIKDNRLCSIEFGKGSNVNRFNRCEYTLGKDVYYLSNDINWEPREDNTISFP